MEPLAIGSLIGGLATKVTDVFVDLGRESRAQRVRVDDSDHRRCLLEHVNRVEVWSRTISMSVLPREKPLTDAFVELTANLGIVKRGAKGVDVHEVTLAEIGGERTHAAILGGPGAGKTTSLQRLAARSYDQWLSGKGGVPLLLRLRDFGEDGSLATALLAEVGITVTAGDKVKKEILRRWELRAAQHYLETVSATLLVDGLDELHSSARSRVEAELRDLVLTDGTFRVVLTCRLAEWSQHLQGVQVYTLQSLSPRQVREFATRWLGENDAVDFMRQLGETPYLGAEVVPLMLANLCAIFRRDGVLPDRALDVYEAIVSLLVEEWDRQRGVRRISRYADFSWRKKERFLQAIAFFLAKNGSRGSFDRPSLINAYRLAAPKFKLPRDEVNEVVREVESHTGLIVSAGHSRFDWVHLSIQEYLAAMHATRLPSAIHEMVPEMPNEMALVVAASADPAAELERVAEYLLNNWNESVAKQFAVTMLGRLVSERPQLDVSARLGWVTIALASKLPDRAESLSFLADVDVCRSTALALSEAQPFFKEDGFARIVPKVTGSRPLWLIDNGAFRNFRVPEPVARLWLTRQ